MTDYLKSHGQKLLDLGYPIIPITKGQKYPAGKKYTNWQKIDADQKQLDRWVKDPSVTGVGIQTSTAPAIDIDVRDPEVVQVVLNYLAHSGLDDFDSIVRTGEEPKCLLPFALEGEPFTKVQSPVYIDSDGVEHKLEILGDGQQYVAYHIHPDTNEPYHYNDGPELTDIAYADLPVLTKRCAEEIVAWFVEHVSTCTNWTRKKGRKRQTSKLKQAVDDIDILNNVVEPLAITDAKVVRTLEGIPSGLGYDDWVAVGMALHHQYKGGKQGYDLFLQWSKLSKKYKTGDVTRTKWNSFEPDYTSAPITFAFPLSLADPSKPAKQIKKLRDLIPDEDEIEKPKKENQNRKVGELTLKKKAAKKLDKYIERYVLVGHKQLVIDVTKPPYQQAMELKDFHVYYANDLVEVIKPLASNPINTIHMPLSKIWTTSVERQSVVNYKYAPGEDRFFTDETDTRYANSFSYPDHEAIAQANGIDYQGRDRLDLFFDHIDYILPFENERKWFLQYIAFTIQKPHLRCPIAPLHIARTPGIGRSWVLRCITWLLGEANVNTVDIEQIIGEKSQFNDHLVDCKIVACEEVYVANTKDRYKAENTLKSDITDMRKQIRRKFGTQKVEQLFCNMFLLSNYGVPMPIPADDRRYNVFSGPLKKRSPQYYAKLMSWLDEHKNGRKYVESNIAQLFDYFNTLDIDDFNVSEPLDTPARRAMISGGKSDVDHLFDVILTDNTQNILTARDVFEIMSENNTSGHIDMQRVGGLLRQRSTLLGSISVNGKPERLWSLNNDTYTNDEAAASYESYINTKHDEEFSDW